MLRSSDRIMTTHAGALPRSERLRGLVMARSQGEPHDAAELADLLRQEVTDTVTKQIAIGLDSVNDGELGSRISPTTSTSASAASKRDPSRRAKTPRFRA